MAVFRQRTSVVCISIAVLQEMKRFLQLPGKLQVRHSPQQLDIPGLCLHGPSVEIWGFSLDCTHIWSPMLDVWVKPHSDSAVRW